MSNSYLRQFAPEIFEMILSFASVPTLLRLGACSKVDYSDVHLHIHNRSRKVVSPFIRNPDHLFLLLGWTSSVISGSTALQYMVPNNTIDWAPRDLDLYVPHTDLPIFLAFFSKEGFQEVQRWTHGHHPSDRDLIATTESDDGTATDSGSDYSDQIPSIQDIIHMTKKSLSIDIITCPGDTPIPAILSFHSTTVMNCLTGHGFLSIYPTLTDQHRSLINRLAYPPDTAPTPRMLACFDKYALRGITTYESPRDWEMPHDESLSNMDTSNTTEKHHDCRTSPNCPNAIRSTFDGGCLFVSFYTAHNFLTPQTMLSSTDNVRRRAGSAVWNMGGPTCNGTRPPMDPFIIASNAQFSG
jgi:hypothetical protein